MGYKLLWRGSRGLILAQNLSVSSTPRNLLPILYLQDQFNVVTALVKSNVKPRHLDIMRYSPNQNKNNNRRLIRSTQVYSNSKIKLNKISIKIRSF